VQTIEMNQRISPDQNLQSQNERTKTLKTNELLQGPRRPESTTLRRPALKISRQTSARMMMKASAFNFFSKASIQIAFPLTFGKSIDSRQEPQINSNPDQMRRL
jgi:hypothetical protein